jgi:CHAD domain-containing protein
MEPLPTLSPTKPGDTTTSDFKELLPALRINIFIAGRSNGLRRTFTRRREAVETAAGKETSLNFHELRKRCKDLRYHLHFLHVLWPRVFEGSSESAKEIEQAVGGDHNLTVLRSVSKELRISRPDISMLRSFIQREQGKLRKNALETAQLLFAERRRHWSRRLDQAWALR